MTGLGHTQWENYSHQQMWDMIMSADPKTVMVSATDLSDMAKAMGDDAEQVRTTLQKLLSTWDGPAADKTAGAIRPVLNWAADAADTASDIAARLGHYAEAINTARTQMPAPVDYRQLDAVADGQTVTVADADLNAPELAAMAHGDTATAQQAAKAKSKAVQVMRHYEQQSAAVHHNMPTFTKAPKLPGLVSKGPAPSPPPPPPPPPRHPLPPRRGPGPGPGPGPTPGPTPTPTGGTSTTVPSSVGSTTPSGFVGPGGALGGVGGGGVGVGMPGGVGLVGPVGGAAGLGAASGPAVSGAVAGQGAAAGLAGTAGELAEEEAGQGGWNGFAPMMGGGARGGDRDGEHRDKYAGEPDIFGDLPPAFPPVLGL